MSKVIFKMTFKHPNKKDTVSKNVSHVEYIASRPGVDKTITESDLKKELEKGVEDFQSDDETYVQYIDERPRSHGLFGKDGLEDPKDVQDEISQVESFVWRGIISLKEEDAKELGFTNKEKWQDMLRAKVPEMAEKMGIRPSNLRWVAAVHMEQGHPHSHVIFWEKEHEKTIGIIKPKILDEIRKLYTDEIFEEQRLELLNEKNAMRDLVRDLANDDISKISRLIRDVNKVGEELDEILGTEQQEGLAPKLYSTEESELIYKIKNLGENLPGKGRINLKFMPEAVKEEVRAIADYLLQQPGIAASVEKNLKAVEELTKLYTGKEDDIQKARENAYNDIRDRVSQTILKGAVESQKENLFYVDHELSSNAVEFIKNINTQIDLTEDYKKVINEVAVALGRTGHNEEEILKHLTDFTERENLNLNKETLENFTKQIKESESGINSINSISFRKNVEYYLSVLKLSGYEETKSFDILKETIKSDSKELEQRLQQLKEDGILKKIEDQYKLTNKGINEFLKVKDLDRAEREILKSLEVDGDIVPKASFEELIENKDVFSNLYNKDPKEFKLGKYDIKVREMFGEGNQISFKELEETIYNKYTDDKLNINTDKADMEIELLEKRIDKLTLNGYVKFDKESELYSFTNEADRCFKYNKEKESYFFTEESAIKLDIKNFEFTRYDANVTLSYIDKVENNVLTEDSLREILEKEIVNQEAQKDYESFTSILESGQAKEYININESGDMTSTDKGQDLGKAINRLNKCFYVCRGKITDDKLKEFCIKEYGDNADKQFYNITKQLEQGIEKGYIKKNNETLSYTIEPMFKDINKLLYQIYKEDGLINKNDLKEVLEKNIPNKEVRKQLNYLVKRLDNLKNEGYLDGQDKEYILNSKGIEKRNDILVPQRDLLREKLDYLERLGLLENKGEGYQAAQKYYTYMKNIAEAKDNKILRTSEVITKDIVSIIDRTQDKVNVGKIERSNERIAMGKYINNEYSDIKSSYEDIRKYCNVPDTIEKTLKNLSTSLIISGVGLQECKEILQQWNLNTNSNIDPEKIDTIIDKSNEVIKENDLWGKITVISTKDWKEMFNSLGINEKDIPKWIYKGENWKDFNHGSGLGLASMVNDLWKATWKQIEIQRMQTQAQVNQMKKQFLKQQSEQSKSAMIEQMRKNKDRGSMHQDEFEL